MKTKPLFLILLPILLFGLALSFPIQIIALYDLSFFDFEKVMSMLTPLNHLTILLLISTAFACQIMSKSIYRILPILTGVVLLNNYIVGTYGSDYSTFQAVLGVGLFAASVLPLYSGSIKSVITDHSKRWWIPAKRVVLRNPIKIVSTKNGIYTNTLDMSASGVFIEITDQAALAKIALNQVIVFKILGIKEVLQGKIVRKNTNSDNKGAGVAMQLIKDNTYQDTYLPWFKERMDHIH